MQKLLHIFSSKPYLAWYIKNKNDLSEESAVEHILNYGDWDDYKNAEEALGLYEINNIFKKLKNKKRVNLRPQTINYFNNYFEKHAE